MKYETDDQSEHFKARLVARSFTQQFEIDYEDIFASVICFESLQILFIIAVREKMFIHMMDAQNAYLNSDLNKKVYMKISEGIENAEKSDSVCLLLKSIYELKQSVNL